MATPSRRTDPPLERTLFEEPYRFDFFQAVRLLERLDAERVAGRARRAAAREVVRFLTRPLAGLPRQRHRSHRASPGRRRRRRRR